MGKVPVHTHMTDAFNYSACRFQIHRGKEGCARVVAHRELRFVSQFASALDPCIYSLQRA